MKKSIAILSIPFSFACLTTSCKTTKQKSGDENNNWVNPTNNQFNFELIKEKLKWIDGNQLNTKNTMKDALNLITNSIKNFKIEAKNIRLTNGNENLNYLNEGDNEFNVSFEINNETLTFLVCIKSVSTVSEIIYDVPSDGSCLFWAVATAYLLPVRNNDKAIKIRFENLFGIN